MLTLIFIHNHAEIEVTKVKRNAFHMRTLYVVRISKSSSHSSSVIIDPIQLVASVKHCGSISMTTYNCTQWSATLARYIDFYGRVSANVSIACTYSLSVNRLLENLVQLLQLDSSPYTGGNSGLVWSCSPSATKQLLHPRPCMRFEKGNSFAVFHDI